MKAAGLSFRDRGILIAAMASTMGDSSCSLAWGGKLAGVADPDLAAGVLSGADEGLSAAERALADWARRVTDDPNATTAADLDELRAAGYDDRQIVAITLFLGLRIAFSTVNDALGSHRTGSWPRACPTGAGRRDLGRPSTSRTALSRALSSRPGVGR